MSASTSASRGSSSSSLGGDAREALAHASPGHRLHQRRRRRAAGPGCRRRSPARARRGRGRRRSRSSSPRPRSARRCRPASRRWRLKLSTTMAVSRSSPRRAGDAIASWFEPSSSSRVADQADDPRAGAPGARSASAVPTAIGRPCPSEPLAISTPGISAAVGMVAERASRSSPKPSSQLVDGNEALRGEHGVVRRRPVALGEQEAVALGIVDRLRVTWRTRS